jgi:hypothetical protein
MTPLAAASLPEWSVSRGRLGLLELADLVLGAADLRAGLVVALARRDLLALGLLVEVGLDRAGLLGDVAVLVRQLLGVVGRLVDDVLVVLDLHHHHVRWRRLLRRRRRLLVLWRRRGRRQRQRR